MDLQCLEGLKERAVDGIKGLYTVVSQDAESGEVLMVAYANKEALIKTLETGKAHYFSTSRKKLWLKGESSGHFQEVLDVFVDCDGDAIIYKITQKGGACHTGYRSCFYRKLDKGGLAVVGEKVFDPDKVY